MQTKKHLQVRNKEHKRATINGQTEKAAMAEHECQEGHEINWVELKLSPGPAHVPHLGLRLIRDTLEIKTK